LKKEIEEKIDKPTIILILTGYIEEGEEREVSNED
jgi:hypothetical protein